MDLGRLAAGLAEELTPMACLELLNDLGSQDCGLALCGPCLSGAQAMEEGCTCCPLYRALFPQEGWNVRQVLASLVEKARRVVSRAREGRVKGTCGEHEEKLKLFCKDDGELVCLICRDSLRHVGHSFLPLQDAVAVYQDQLISGLDPLESTLNEFQQLMRDQEEEIIRLRGVMFDYRIHLASEFEELHQFLRSREEALARDLEREGDPALRDMEANLTRIQEHCRQIQDLILGTQSRLQREDSITFLTDVKSFLEKCLEGQQQAVVPAQHSVVSRELTPGQFKGPIQYGAWKAMKCIISPDLSCLVLDADTAHSDFRLSEDRTMVRHDITKPPPASRPEKGFQSIFVLGSAGYASGRHYWEVEVGKKPSWTVGVADETVRRKEGVELKEGNGVWAIWLRNGFIYRASPKPLILRGRPQKLGVYLDYEGGQVSFYNADDMTHLYTFNSTFIGKLFPLFDPGVNTLGNNGEALKIVHVTI